MNDSYILVTGSSSGIGRVIAIKLSEHYPVILHGRDAGRLQQTKNACSSAHKVLIWQADLNETETISSELTDFLLDNRIVVSGFVHCAGWMKMLPLKMLSWEVMSKTFHTNMFAAAFILKTLIQKKINKGALKSVVFISSNISNRGAKAFSIYAASKGALDSFMRCVAMELAPQARVNSVLPGAVLTEMTGEIFENEEVRTRMASTYPLGFGHPEDIYEMVAFLLSDKSRWITGQQFVVDGGRTINVTG